MTRENYFMIESQDEQRVRDNLVPDNSSYALTSLPESVLAQHGARMLDPATAAQVENYVAIHPTAYRAAELLIPGEVPKADIDNVLGHDLGLMTEAVGGTRYQLVPDTDAARRRDRKERGTPSAAGIDAWKALQTLRSATMEGDGRLNHVGDTIRNISLNRLLIGSAMGGLGGVSVLNGVPGAIGGNPDPGRDAGDLGYWRFPVAMKLPAAHRSDDDESRRRPVIAVLDTGLGVSDWLGIVDETRPGPFVSVDLGIQQAVRSPISPGPVSITWDHPSTGTPLTGYLSTHAGHGTFIIGVIHQVEPDADVLSIRIMHEDGIVYSDVLICVLEKLIARVTTAQADWTEAANIEDSDARKKAQTEAAKGMVDIVSLSLGGYREHGTGGKEYDGIEAKIKELRALGVVVVASAGNYASSKPFMPAALASQQVDGQPLVVSVGARNPNGTKALFTNDAEWVKTWALGAGIVSTFPEDTNGSGNARYRVKASTAKNGDTLGIRESLEIDDYRSGYAMWAGTSFATPAVAAEIARLLKRNDLTDIGREATLDRAKAAVRDIL
jgi:hypothetical protein